MSWHEGDTTRALALDVREAARLVPVAVDQPSFPLFLAARTAAFKVVVLVECSACKPFGSKHANQGFPILQSVCL